MTPFGNKAIPVFLAALCFGCAGDEPPPIPVDLSLEIAAPEGVDPGATVHLSVHHAWSNTGELRYPAGNRGRFRDRARGLEFQLRLPGGTRRRLAGVCMGGLRRRRNPLHSNEPRRPRRPDRDRRIPVATGIGLVVSGRPLRGSRLVLPRPGTRSPQATATIEPPDAPTSAARRASAPDARIAARRC